MSAQVDNRSARWREHYRRQYPGLMSSQADGTPEQKAFGNWVSDQLAFLKDTRGLSMRAACKIAGVSHTQVYSWMGQPESSGYADASAAAVKRFCERLKLDYKEAAVLLGWVKAEAPPPPPKDLPGFIDRAQRLANHPRTSPERRRVLEAQIKVARQTLQAARDMERTAEELLREALGEHDTADEDAADR